MGAKEAREREAVMNAYGGSEWKKKVEKMPDYQVTAVYLRLKDQGRIK